MAHLQNTDHEITNELTYLKFQDNSSKKNACLKKSKIVKIVKSQHKNYK